MSERNEYIPGVPCWVDASYKEPESVLPFYRGLFGWDFIPAMETPGERFFIATIRGRSTAGIGELPADHPPVPAWNTYVAVTSADEAVDKVRAAVSEVLAPAVNDTDVAAADAPKLGGKALVPPLDAPYVRLTVLADPEGTPFTASQFVAENR
jgi:predicted enzyme related to lactoylglutathione lyase